MIPGPEYNLNDVACPSFIATTDSSDVVLAILMQDKTIKFLNVATDINNIFDGIYVEELGIFYLNSFQKTGFFTVGKRLRDDNFT